MTDRRQPPAEGMTLTREQLEQQISLMVNACSIDCQPETCLCQHIEDAALRSLEGPSILDDLIQWLDARGVASVVAPWGNENVKGKTYRKLIEEFQSAQRAR